MVTQIGSGSYGKVYLGIDKNTLEEVAIKMEPLFGEHSQIENELDILLNISGTGFPRVK